MQVCTIVSAKTALMASGKPFRGLVATFLRGCGYPLNDAIVMFC
ncbi:hypothetical protein PDO_5014 [Rhizobium sp. PDO1-076]|nr:hypothetical protein PDO_5014 [Rhizobium sp. PDO1-076]